MTNSKALIPATIPNQLQLKDSSVNLSVNVAQKLDSYTGKLAVVNRQTREIAQQGGFAAFFQKGKNIRELAEHIEIITHVQQGTMDMMVLLMNGLVVTKRDYNTLMGLMEKLGKDSTLDKQTKTFVKNAKALLEANHQVKDEIDQVRLGHNDLLKYITEFQSEYHAHAGSVTMAIGQNAEALGEIGKSITDTRNDSSKKLRGVSTKIENNRNKLDNLRISLINLEKDTTVQLEQLRESTVRIEDLASSNERMNDSIQSLAENVREWNASLTASVKQQIEELAACTQTNATACSDLRQDLETAESNLESVTAVVEEHHKSAVTEGESIIEQLKSSDAMTVQKIEQLKNELVTVSHKHTDEARELQTAIRRCRMYNYIAISAAGISILALGLSNIL